MRKLAALTFMTLDGVIQAPGHPEEDTSNGFTQGGWAGDYWQEVMQQVMTEAMADPYDILLGRKTYDIFASHWPSVNSDNPVSEIMNNAQKYIVTSSQEDLSWNNSIPVQGEIPTEIAKLKQQDGPLLQIHGSGQLIQALLKHNLIDELRLWTFPVTVGGGKRLFESGSIPTRFELIKTEPCANGVIMSIYGIQS
ncbi:dihydrofolate reductase family protein [Marinicella sp. W31]|uniref:dihydrofolate reductase family protein n=1 Tax=Marinicella sp. W31 TaxID=3023713 RepID=UPI00375742BF